MTPRRPRRDRERRRGRRRRSSSSTTSTGTTRAWPSLSPGSPTGPRCPTPLGVFRDVQRPVYGDGDGAPAAAGRRAAGPRRPGPAPGVGRHLGGRRRQLTPDRLIARGLGRERGTSMADAVGGGAPGAAHDEQVEALALKLLRSPSENGLEPRRHRSRPQVGARACSRTRKLAPTTRPRRTPSTTASSGARRARPRPAAKRSIRRAHDGE